METREIVSRLDVLTLTKAHAMVASMKNALPISLAMIIGACWFWVGCAGSAAEHVWNPTTTLKLAAAGPCTAQGCGCRSLDAAAAKERAIPAGFKRFEFRLPRSTSALWVRVGAYGTFYKPPGQVDPTCFYLDLDPGRHEIEVHGESRDAEVRLHTGLGVYEYGEPAGAGGEPTWYRAAHFACGIGASPCSRDEVDAWVRFVKGLPRGVLDPCGSVMAKAADFSGVREQKGDEAYRSLTLRFFLKIYRFKPHRRSGSPQCRAPRKNR